MKHTPRKMHKQRGIVLLTTLLVIVLVAMLLSAFFQVNKTQVSVMQTLQGQDTLKRSAFSIASYLQSRLEQNTIWPAASVSGTVPNDVDGIITIDRIQVVSSEDNTHEVWGHYAPERVAFYAKLHNNLTGDDEFTPDDATEDYETIPPNSVRIFLETYRANSPTDTSKPLHAASEAQVFTFRKAGQIDSTMVSSKGIFLDARELAFTSKDEVRNQIRSLDDVEFSNLEAIGFGSTESTAPGVVWARGQIQVDGQPIVEQIESLTQASGTVTSGPPGNTTTTTEELPMGRFMEGAVGEFGKPAFDLEDIQSLKTDGGDAREDVVLYEGVWEFTKVPVTYTPSWPGDHPESDHLDVLVHRSSADDDAVINGVYAEVAWNAGHFNIDSADLPISSDDVIKLSGWGDAEYHLPVKNGGDGYDMSHANAPRLSMRNRTISLNPDVNYRVEGNFGVATNIVDTDVITDPGAKPSIVLAGGFHNGNPSSLIDHRAYLEVEGDFYVDGSLLGVGNIVAHQDIDFSLVEGTVAADEETDFALYAGNDITVRGDESLTDITMEGLIYAKNNVIFDFSGEDIEPLDDYTNADDPRISEYPPSSSQQGNFKVEGAVVAQDGGMVVKGIQKAEFVYNPKFVDNLFAVNSTTMRLEAVSWWPVR